MHRILLTALCLLSHGQVLHADAPPCTLQAEYRYDAVDFEESASHFFRMKSALNFSRASSFNIAAVYREYNRETSPRYTWNLTLRDISPCVSLVAGHYYMHIGAGLFIGQKSAFNFDAFSPKSRREGAEPVAAADSGDPARAFYGAVAGIDCGPGKFILACRTFYSLNTRYINEEDYYAGASDAGLGSVSSSTVKNHARFEPVLVETYGTMAHFSIAGNLHFSVFAARSGINRPSGGHVDFSSEAGHDDRTGIRDTTGTGFYAQYADSVLTCFLETAFTWKSVYNACRRTGTIRGTGTIGGVSIKMPVFRMSFTGKYTAPGYYAPFASTTGEDHPERAWFITNELCPFPRLALGAQIADEKELAPPSGGKEPGSARRSTCYVRCSHGALLSARLAYRVLDRNGYSDNCDRRQTVLTSEWGIHEGFEIDSVCIRQTARGFEAYYASAGACVGFLRCCSASVQYGRSWASSGNAVYASALPLPQSGISLIALRQGCHVLAARCALKLSSFSVYARYFLQLSGPSILDQRIELLASGRW